jgi:hypothetical protein
LEKIRESAEAETEFYTRQAVFYPAALATQLNRPFHISGFPLSAVLPKRKYSGFLGVKIDQRDPRLHTKKIFISKSLGILLFSHTKNIV